MRAPLMSAGRSPEDPGRSVVRERIASAAAQVRAAIDGALARSGRAQAVRLVAVAKGFPIEVVEAAIEAGLADIGENFVRELADATGAGLSATWHYLGRLQSGTAHRVADLAQVVHSAEPGSGLERLSRRARDAGRPCDCLLQVDFTGRRQGVAPEEVPGAADEVTGMPGIRLVGLMTLPPFTAEPEGARPFFRRLRDLRDALEADHPGARELSMGMSRDYTVAVEEGATMVRVGTAVFGRRPSDRTARP